MYNCSCWAASKQLLNKLDICHRKHLRQIIRMTYPNIIKNDTLYKRCEVVPLSERVACARWRMLGHVLRSDNNSPAQLALHFAVESQSTKKGRVGRHQSNLLRTIQFDLEVSCSLQARQTPTNPDTPRQTPTCRDMSYGGGPMVKNGEKW